MTHLQPTTPVAGTGRGTSSQAQRPVQADATNTCPTQDPLYPPGLGFSSPFHAIARARGLEIHGEVVVPYGTRSSLLDEPLEDLDPHDHDLDLHIEALHASIRTLPAVSLGLPQPPVRGVEHVPRWPPQLARHEKMARPGRQLSMLADLDLEAKNVMPLNLEGVCEGFSCTLCAEKASDAPRTSCEVKPVNPQEFMDFHFLDEDEYAQVPARSPTPSVDEEGSVLRSREGSEAGSTDNGSAFLFFSGSPLSPGMPWIPLRAMKDHWLRAYMTRNDAVGLRCEGHIIGDVTEDTLHFFSDAPERALSDFDEMWQPSQVCRLEEEEEEDEET